MVVIKDFEMPKSCTDCEMTFCGRDNCDYCGITHSCVDWCAMHNLKADDCPLVEIGEVEDGKA